MMTWKNSICAVVLMTLAGCGCDTDSEFSSLVTSPAVESAAPEVGTTIPPCELTPPTSDAPVPIDVLFLLDDGGTMEQSRLGILPDNLGFDTRTRTEGAQGIMADFEAQILADLQARYPGRTFDLAFGVARYEDYGGSFASDPNGRNIPDEVARPFILNMPILRQARADFDAKFAEALAKTAPGDGRKLDTSGPAPILDNLDPNTVIEALWQAAVGDGFDGNGDGDTGDSGAPCSATSQTAPGDSGDVPAVTWTAAGNDADGRPQFTAADNAECVASGNLGGVGWRNEAARFVIMSGDIATVAPFSGTVPANIQSTAGDAGGGLQGVLPDCCPREARLIDSTAFDNNTGRFGELAGNPSIAPLGAATVEETIDALNALCIEVMAIGAPFLVPGDVKPNGSQGSHIEAIGPGSGPGTYGDPTLTYWTMASAISVLTGSEVRAVDDTLTERVFPAVYNIGTVWPWNQGTASADPVTNFVREDFGQLTDAWFASECLTTGGSSSLNVQPEDIPLLFLDVTLTPMPGPGFGTEVVPTVPLAPETITIPVPVYVTGQTAPAGARTNFTAWAFAPASEELAFPITDSLPFQITMAVNRIEQQPGANQATHDVLLALLREKLVNLNGDGPDFIGAEAVARLELEEVPPDSTEEVTISTVVRGCGFLVPEPEAADVLFGTQPCNPFDTDQGAP